MRPAASKLCLTSYQLSEVLPAALGSGTSTATGSGRSPALRHRLRGLHSQGSSGSSWRDSGARPPSAGLSKVCGWQGFVVWLVLSWQIRLLPSSG